MHICVCVHICACTLVGGSQPLMDQSSADSFSQLLNFTFPNYSYPEGRNTMIKQLCLSRATKHVAQQEALILDTRMKKSDTLPLLPMTAGGGRTQKLCASRQSRGDVRLLPLLPSLLITGAESLSHSEPKGLIMHPGNKTTGWEGSLLDAICSKTNHKSGRCEFFASNLLAQASTKQTINVRQPDIPEKRVMSCTSLVALTLAGHPRGSSSTTIQMDKASEYHVLVQQHIQMHRFCRVCEHPGQIQGAKPDPYIPRAHFFGKEEKLQHKKEHTLASAGSPAWYRG